MDITRDKTPGMRSLEDRLISSMTLWIILGMIVFLLFGVFSQVPPWRGERRVAFSDFLDQVDAGTVTEVTFQGGSVHYATTQDDRLNTYIPFDPDLIKLLRAKRVKIMAEPEESDPWWIVTLAEWFPMLLLVAVLITYNEKRLASAGR